jgi:hypothetical protein
MIIYLTALSNIYFSFCIFEVNTSILPYIPVQPSSHSSHTDAHNDSSVIMFTSDKQFGAG